MELGIWTSFPIRLAPPPGNIGRYATPIHRTFCAPEMILTLFLQLDQDALICDHATCKKSFNTFTRRHHCRRCGNIFCGAHSDYQIPLDQDANYNPRGVPSRACAHCFNQFRAWRSRANSQSSSRGSSDGGNAPETPVTPTAAAPVAAIAPGLMRPLQARVAEVAHSVPRDWNWSTF